MGNIITCISGPDLKSAISQITEKPMGELRLDLLNLTHEEIKNLWSKADDWVLTLREKFLEKPNWKSTFKLCLSLKPRYVDLDSELSSAVKSEVASWVKTTDSDLMYSYHNFQETPDFEELNAVISSLYNDGADVVKVACLALKEEDNLIVMDLYRAHKRLVAFCMGEHGKESRVTALFFGEKLTYAAPSAEEIIAPGQFTYNELYELLNFGFDE